jgi:hypothetical protein
MNTKLQPVIVVNTGHLITIGTNNESTHDTHEYEIDTDPLPAIAAAKKNLQNYQDTRIKCAGNGQDATHHSNALQQQ